jgi:hypothetical protein
MILIITPIYLTLSILVGLIIRVYRSRQIINILKCIAVGLTIAVAINLWYIYCLYISQYSVLGHYVSERLSMYYHYKYSADFLEAITMVIREVLPYVSKAHLIILVVMNSLIIYYAFNLLNS